MKIIDMEKLQQVVADPLAKEKADLARAAMNRAVNVDLLSTLVFAEFCEANIVASKDTAHEQFWKNHLTGCYVLINDSMPKLSETQTKVLDEVTRLSLEQGIPVTSADILIKVRDWQSGVRCKRSLWADEDSYNKQGSTNAKGKGIPVKGKDGKSYTVDILRSNLHTGTHTPANPLPAAKTCTPTGAFLGMDKEHKAYFKYKGARDCMTPARVNSAIELRRTPADRNAWEAFNKQGASADSKPSQIEGTPTQGSEDTSVVTTSVVTQGCAKCNKMVPITELKTWAPKHPDGVEFSAEEIKQIVQSTGISVSAGICEACEKHLHSAISRATLAGELNQANVELKQCETALANLQKAADSNPALADAIKPGLDAATEAFNKQGKKVEALNQRLASFKVAKPAGQQGPTQPVNTPDKFGTKLDTSGLKGKPNPTTTATATTSVTAPMNAKQRKAAEHKAHKAALKAKNKGK